MRTSICRLNVRTPRLRASAPGSRMSRTLKKRALDRWAPGGDGGERTLWGIGRSGLPAPAHESAELLFSAQRAGAPRGGRGAGGCVGAAGAPAANTSGHSEVVGDVAKGFGGGGSNDWPRSAFRSAAAKGVVGATAQRGVSADNQLAPLFAGVHQPDQRPRGEKAERGLGGRHHLPENRGRISLFGAADRQGLAKDRGVSLRGFFGERRVLARAGQSAG